MVVVVFRGSRYYKLLSFYLSSQVEYVLYALKFDIVILFDTYVTSPPFLEHLSVDVCVVMV